MTHLSRRGFLWAGSLAFAAMNPDGWLELAAEPVGQGSRPVKPALTNVKALVFDTFGTVVDWRSSVIAEGRQLGQEKHLQVDWAKFADAWRAGYAPSMDRVRKGELPWTKLDVLHRGILDKLLVDFKVGGLSEAEKEHFNRAWHRLKPWPDAVAGLTRLKTRYIIAPLSNGNVSLMTELAKFGGLPWDCILGAELAKHYKPDREVYQSAADFLDLPPNQIIMVAAHQGDLRAAGGVGLKTAFVPRPLEYGPDRKVDSTPDPSFDLVATDFNDLAAQLGV
jgi:2-haloacid dehalogenase